MIKKRMVSKVSLLDKRIERKLNKALKKVQEELDDHLTAINENTDEIDAGTEVVQKINDKIEKLDEKIADLQLMFAELKPIKLSLSANEQRVFLVLYMFGEKYPLKCSDIAKKLATTEYEARHYLSLLIAKGVPIVEELVNDKLYFNIDPEFRELQAKENVLKIDETVSKGLFVKNLKNFF